MHVQNDKINSRLKLKKKIERVSRQQRHRMHVSESCLVEMAPGFDTQFDPVELIGTQILFTDPLPLMTATSGRRITHRALPDADPPLLLASTLWPAA